MTLLTIAQDAAVEIGGFDVPGTVIGNSDANAQRLLRAAQRVGSDLVTRADWSILRTQRTLTATATEAQANAIPFDAARMIPETLWDRTNDTLISGPIPSARYQSLVATWTSTSYPRWFTLRGTALAIFPAMQGGETLAFEYVSNQFCASAGGTLQARWQADTDVGRLSEEMMTLGVVAFFLMSQGLPYAVQMGAYEARVTRELQNDDPSNDVLASGDIFTGQGGRNWDGTPSGGPILGW